MIYRRPPQSLKEMAFLSWLTALDVGTTKPALAPPLLLIRALEGGAKLKDATVVRIAQEAATAGVKEITVKEELLNPFLFHQLTQALNLQSSKFRKLDLKLSSRVNYEDTNALLAKALKGMVNLEEVSLIEGANDNLLKALAIAQPPLINVDFSYSRQVSDDGLKALLTTSTKKFKSTERGSFQNLKNLNVWDTRVTTNGCILVLKYCPNLLSLMCQWTAEALVLMEMKQCNPVRLEQLFINKEELKGNLFKAITNLCPCLKTLTIRRPKDTTINLEEVLTELPAIQDFSLLQFNPLYYSSIKLPFMRKLKRLCISSLCSSNINLDLLLVNCPLLTQLTLDGVNPELNNRATMQASSISYITDKIALERLNIFRNLTELRILSSYISFRPLDPSLIVSIMNEMVKNIRFLHLDNCEYFQENHFMSLINDGSLSQVEDVRFSRASNLSDEVIHAITRCCPNLKRLVLTMLSRERREQLEELKVYLRVNNINLEIITFCNRSLTESMYPQK